MLQSWLVVGIALGYIGFLFAVASYGDRARSGTRPPSNRSLIYPLSLAVYCTSWTFFGSVGLASKQGYDFLTIYIGPVLMIGLGYPLILKVVRLAKSQNITSIADFIAARYGKSPAVAALVTIVAVIGAVPYIALQLKAVSASLTTMLGHDLTGELEVPLFGDLAFLVAIAMSIFAVLFGTRHTDATEHQRGMMLAIATESVVKLFAFLIVGAYITFVIFNGPIDLWTKAASRGDILPIFGRSFDIGNWLTMTLLSFVCVLLLPRQFHVAVVENNNEAEIRRATWLFPLYLLLINLFVVPIALAGLYVFPRDAVDSDMFVLALPLKAGSGFFAMLAFVGGLSAATAMVIVESVAVAIMVSNDIVVPLILRRKRSDMSTLLLQSRRLSILAVLMLAYLYYHVAGEAQLAQIGLLSFAAIAQFAPAFFAGLFWRGATARGSIAGIMTGVAMWAYTLFLPSLIASGLFDTSILYAGPFGIEWLKPQALFDLRMGSLTHGVLWSLGLNVLAFVAVSFFTKPTPIERLQASVFVRAELMPITPSFSLWRSSVTAEDLIATVSRYLGEDRTRRSFADFARTRGIPLDSKRDADAHTLRYAEHLLASAIGAASSRLVLSLLLRKRNVSTKAALRLLDDASAAIQYNREILQTALDHVRQGIAVFDKDLQLVCWNRHFGEMLGLPPELVRIGATLDAILRFGAERGDFGSGNLDALVADRLERYVTRTETFHERLPMHNVVVEVRSNRMPDGGIVVTYTDITPAVEAAEALERANENLERRVRERTEELTLLNRELGRAKAAADDANISKTRFLAAASHDILQPLNAARLYATSLVERERGGDKSKLAINVDASLEAVEEILSALLDISRLDTGSLQPEFSHVRIDEILSQLEVEFAPIAHEKGLKLIFIPCSLTVRTDRRLLRRLLQNLVANAIKYTPRGRVLVGCRRLKNGRLRVDIIDTGLGIPADKQTIIFQEFQRLNQGAQAARGLGLGLSIVERIGRVLDHAIGLRSAPGEGSSFSVTIPTAPAVIRSDSPRAAETRPVISLEAVEIMCVENDMRVLEGMQALLGGWGCRVIAAPGLEVAMKALQAGARPDVLLVDYHLDEGTGIDAIRVLRSKIGGELPAALVTAERSPIVREEARAAGIQVLYKPLKPAMLRAFIAQWRIVGSAAE